jgi:hypothetical protein
MSERHGIRGDGLGVSQRERTGVVVTASEDRVMSVRLNRVRATWDAEIDIDVLPPPQRKLDRKPSPKR